ncbi:MAG: thioesterase II family protein [Thermoplasmatota archaeon]
MRPPAVSRSVSCFGPRVDGDRVRLFCFPYGGSGSGVFRGWGRHLPPQTEVWGVNLPGRESRYGEPMPASMQDLAAETAGSISPLLDGPAVFFGHSMGALLAFEVVRRLSAQGGPLPATLIASGYRAPQLPPIGPLLHGLADGPLLDQMARVGGVSAGLLQSPEILELVLPTLRADIGLCENYRYRPGPRLPCRVVALGGEADVEVPAGDLRGWERQAGAGFASQLFPGGHFFIETAQAGFFAVLASEVAWASARRRAPL